MSLNPRSKRIGDLESLAGLPRDALGGARIGPEVFQLNLSRAADDVRSAQWGAACRATRAPLTLEVSRRNVLS